MKINDYLTRDELAQFTAKSDLHAARLVLGNWLAIANVPVFRGYAQVLRHTVAG
jgi:hypothetical protein